ncbi:MAG: hypothetical protein ACUVWP_01020 [bacterium]
MKIITIIFILSAITFIHSSPGDIVREFTLEGQPAGGVRGLEYDPADGNIWAVGPNTQNNVYFCKFISGQVNSIVHIWQRLDGQYWCFDVAYKYVFDGKDCIVVCDSASPRYKLHDVKDGSYVGFLPDAYTDGYNVGIGADYKNNWGVTLYASNYSYTDIMRWNGSSWSVWATTSSPSMGICYGWAHVFNIITEPVYKILSFHIADGKMDNEIQLNNWGTCYMVGLARGRDNYDGKNETLYTACFYPSNFIREIDIGQYNQTGIETTSVGNIKALYH